MDHVIVLFDIFILVVGTLIAFHTFQIYRSHRFQFLKSLFHYIIFYNLTVFVHFIIGYTRTNLFRPDVAGVHPLLTTFIYAAGFITEIGLATTLVEVVRGLRDAKEQAPVKRSLVVGSILFAIGYLIGLTSYLGTGSPRRLALAYFALVAAAMFIIIVSLMVLLVDRRKELSPGHRTANRGLAYLLLSGYLLLVVSLLLSEALFRYLSSLTLLWLNVVPYLWIHWYFLPHYVRFTTMEEGLVLDNLVRQYGISKREREVMELILAGKSNKEIEDLLFISFNTVKNHVYNLYQKMGVKSRGHLVHLVSTYQKPPQG